MTSSCKWTINRASKDKHGDLFLVFFLASSRTYNLCVESMPETDFGMPSMTQLMARLGRVCRASRASQKIRHARHAGDFGTLGMLGTNYLLLEPRLLAASVGRSRNLKLCLQSMRNSVACQFQCKTTLGPPPLLPVRKSLMIGMGKILAC